MKTVEAAKTKSLADMETVSLSNNPRFLALIERSRAQQKLKGGITTEERRHRLHTHS